MVAGCERWHSLPHPPHNVMELDQNLIYLEGGGRGEGGHDGGYEGGEAPHYDALELDEGQVGRPHLYRLLHGVQVSQVCVCRQPWIETGQILVCFAGLNYSIRILTVISKQQFFVLSNV